MSVPNSFYQEQAAICAEAAASANLPMLRQKYEAAGAAWEALARRESDIANARERRLAEAAQKARGEIA